LSPLDPSRPGEDPVFNEPWEAQAFSMAVALSERGLFTWPEWADGLAEVIADPETAGLPYYEQWLLALEKLLTSRSLVSDEELADRREAWRAAALATPHGMPIVLPASASASASASAPAPKPGPGPRSPDSAGATSQADAAGAGGLER
jgi:nitrile hydratase accessory protein